MEQALGDVLQDRACGRIIAGQRIELLGITQAVHQQPITGRRFGGWLLARSRSASVCSQIDPLSAVTAE